MWFRVTTLNLVNARGCECMRMRTWHMHVFDRFWRENSLPNPTPLHIVLELPRLLGFVGM